MHTLLRVWTVRKSLKKKTLTELIFSDYLVIILHSGMVWYMFSFLRSVSDTPTCFSEREVGAQEKEEDT